MKFKEETCGNCGFDLATVEPVMAREVPAPEGDGIEMVFIAACPGCHTNRIVAAPKPPKARGTRRRASEPESEPESKPEE